MQKLNSFILVVTVLLLCVGQARGAEQPKVKTTADEILFLLSTKQFLIPKEQEKLAKFLDQLAKAEPDLAAFKIVSGEIVRKANDDKVFLEGILTDVLKLVDTKYVKHVVDVRKSDYEGCFKKLEVLSKELRTGMPFVYKRKERTNPQVYLNTIQGNKGFLTGEGPTESIWSTWECLDSQLAKSYPHLNERYRALLMKVEENKRPDYKYYNILTNEELKFVNLFDRIQRDLRQVTKMNSDRY